MEIVQTIGFDDLKPMLKFLENISTQNLPPQKMVFERVDAELKVDLGKIPFELRDFINKPMYMLTDLIENYEYFQSPIGYVALLEKFENFTDTFSKISSFVGKFTAQKAEKENDLERARIFYLAGRVISYIFSNIETYIRKTRGELKKKGILSQDEIEIINKEMAGKLSPLFFGIFKIFNSCILIENKQAEPETFFDELPTVLSTAQSL